MLFAVNNEGRVFGLSTNGTKWREFPYLGLDFKSISAIPNFLWAVGGDRQIYVHVHGLDIPIRIKEVSFENQVCPNLCYPLENTLTHFNMVVNKLVNTCVPTRYSYRLTSSTIMSLHQISCHVYMYTCMPGCFGNPILIITEVASHRRVFESVTPHRSS